VGARLWRAGRRPLNVVAIDFGVKRNILRLLADRGCKVTVVPPTTSADEIMALKPDGVFLANGPGDPAATGLYSVPTIKALLERKVPTFGICLGHQMLALAIGASTMKMPQGHHGANHPVKEHATGKVEIVSMNHGFAVDPGTLPANAEETHVSLFDGSNCGLKLKDRPAFSVQHHPEASPGPRDSHYLFDRFVDLMKSEQGGLTGGVLAEGPGCPSTDGQRRDRLLRLDLGGLDHRVPFGHLVGVITRQTPPGRAASSHEAELGSPLGSRRRPAPPARPWPAWSRASAASAAGANSASQLSASASATPCSFSVGTSGNCGARLSWPAPCARIARP
jgi:anthranilate/para-aminobenzoate synthase component II